LLRCLPCSVRTATLISPFSVSDRSVSWTPRLDSPANSAMVATAGKQAFVRSWWWCARIISTSLSELFSLDPLPASSAQFIARVLIAR